MTSPELYQTDLILRITAISANQLKYWVKIGLVEPHRNGKKSFYTFRDIVKLKVISSLKKNGLSLQTIRKGIDNLAKVLPGNADPLSRLIIFTDGLDMIVMEKGMYYSATSMQRFFRFDTEQLQTSIIELQSMETTREDDISSLAGISGM